MKVWVGFHPGIGIVIFDPMLQSDIEHRHVRLWAIESQEVRLFDRLMARTNLSSLKSHLVVNRLEPLVVMHGIVGQVARRYLQHRPLTPALPIDTESSDEPWVGNDFDEERSLISQEFSEDQDAWTRSEEDGWFYED